MKKYLTVLLSMLLIGTVIAGGLLTNIDKSLNVFTKSEKTALDNKNLGSYSVTDYDIGEDYKKRCLTKKFAINTCQRFQTYYMNCTLYNEEVGECLNEVRRDFTDEEMSTKMNNWEEERLKGIAQVEIVRQNPDVEVPTKEGTTTIGEKK